MTAAIREYFVEHPEEFDPRGYFKEATNAAQQLCKERFEAFGSAGQAGKIKIVSLEKMANLY
ncbi:Fructose-bisphosphate aldolase [compost metagenome]